MQLNIQFKGSGSILRNVKLFLQDLLKAYVVIIISLNTLFGITNTLLLMLYLY